MVRRLKRVNEHSEKHGLRPARLKFIEYKRICKERGEEETQEGFLKFLVLGDKAIKQNYDKYLIDHSLEDNLESFALFRNMIEDKVEELRGDK